MNRRLMAGLTTHLGVAALVCVTRTPAFGSGEPQESLLYQDFVRASEVLERAVAAHGGPELLDRTRDMRVSFTGTFRYEGHGERPWAYVDLPLQGALIHSATLGAVRSEWTRESWLPMASFTIVGPASGLTDASTKLDSHPRSGSRGTTA